MKQIIFEEHWNKYNADWWVVIEEYGDKSILASLYKGNRNGVPWSKKPLMNKNSVQGVIDEWFGLNEIIFAPKTSSNALSSWVSIPNG